MVGLGITYSVTGGQSLKRFWAIVCQKNDEGTCATHFGLSAWIIVFTGVHLILIQVSCDSAVCIVLAHALEHIAPLSIILQPSILQS